MAAKKIQPKLRPALPKNDEGKVIWRDLIDPKYFYLNKNKCHAKGIPVNTLTEEETAEIIKTADEDQIIISLDGFRELAYKRGVKSVDISLVQDDPNWKIARCSIEFLPNEDEPEGYINSDLGDAHIATTHSDFIPYMGALAANRAFIRTVRNYFRIKSLGKEEINPNEKEIPVAEYDPRPAGKLNDILKKKDLTFENLKEIIESSQYEWKNWKSSLEIPPPDIFSFLELLDKK